MEEDEARLLDAFGVEGVETPESRIVKIADSSTVVCPMHATRLLPDACRSCSFLVPLQATFALLGSAA
jgi:hypothetical protein